MAAVSYALLLCPDKVWEPLPEEARDHLADWLWEINRHECVASNWQDRKSTRLNSSHWS